MQTYKDERTKKQVQAKAQKITFLTSAVWHGLYPGYLIFFVHCMLYLRINQELYKLRKKHPRFRAKWEQWKLDAVENWVANYVFMYFGISFHLMTLDLIALYLKATYMLPYFALYLVYGLMTRTKWVQAQVMKI